MPPAAAVRMTVWQPAAMPGAQRVDHLGGVEALVEVAAARPGRGSGARRGGPTSPGPGARRPCRAGRRAGCRAGRAPRRRPGPRRPRRGRCPGRTSTSWCSVPRRRASSRALLRRPVGGVLHAAMVEGGPPARPHNISRACPPRPPLPPCTPWPRSTGDEIIAAREIVYASGRAEVPNEALRFAYVGLCDPPKEMVRAVDRGEDVAIDRRVRLVLLQGPEADVVEVDRVGHPGRGRPLGDRARRAAAAPDGGVDHGAGRAARAPGLERRPGPAGHRRPSLVQIDPWPAGTFGLGHEEGRRITRCLAYLRESKEDNGYARPLEGLLAFVDMGRGEVLEVVDLGVVPAAAQARELLPRGQRAAAHRPQAAGDHPARGPELRGRRQPRALAEVVAARRHGPAGGPGALDGRLRGRRPGPARSSTGPRSARWSCPTGTPARCTPGRAPSTPASGASAAWPTR